MICLFTDETGLAWEGEHDGEGGGLIHVCFLECLAGMLVYGTALRQAIVLESARQIDEILAMHALTCWSCSYMSFFPPNLC